MLLLYVLSAFWISVSVGRPSALMNDALNLAKRKIVSEVLVSAGCEDDGSTRDDPLNCAGYLECVHKAWVSRPCAPGTVFNKEQKACARGTCRNANGRCVEGQIMKNEDDCSQYDTCVSGELVTKKCPEGTVFDEKIAVCNWGKCPSPTDQPSTGSTTPADDESCGEHLSRRPRPDNCSIFQTCLDDKWVDTPCPDKMVYSPSDGGCVEGACPDRNVCKDLSTRPQPGADCQYYQFCMNNVWLNRRCTDLSMVYSQKLGGCRTGTCGDGADDKYCIEWEQRPHPTECRAYERCQKLKWITVRCSKDHKYDHQKKACVPGDCESTSESTEAPTTEVTSQGTTSGGTGLCKAGEHRPHPNECRAYLKCYDERWALAWCMEGNKYDPDKGSCVPGDCESTSKSTETTEVSTEPTAASTSSSGATTEESPSSTATTTPVSTATTAATTVTASVSTATTTPSGSCEHGVMRTKPDDCHKFQTCVHGAWVTRDCPETLFFDEKLMTCMPGKCPSGSGSSESTETTEETESGDGETESTGTTEETAGTGATEENTEESGDGETETASSESTDATEEVTEESGDGETETSSSQSTEGTEEVTEESGEGETETSDAVTEEVSSTEGATPTTPATTEAPTKSENEHRMECTTTGETAAHPDDVEKFKVCIYGEYEDVSCPPGLVYHASKAECDYATPKSACKDDESGRAIKDDCTKFLSCIKGTWNVQKCPEGSQFNANERKCVKDFKCGQQGKCKAGEKRSHKQDCQKYMECGESNDWTEKECPKGQIYNNLKSKCAEGVCEKGGAVKCGADKNQNHPWTVSMLFENEGQKEVNSNVHECGGVLLSDSWVLTTRNCFLQWDDRLGLRATPDPSRWQVKSGLDRFSVSNIHLLTLKNGRFGDLALVRLMDAVPLSTYRNVPCLPGPQSAAKLNSEVLVTSWELHLEDSTLIPKTHAVTIPGQVPARCNKFYGPLTGEIAPDTDCVDIDEFETSKCTHDMGSPVLTGADGQFELYAVVSGDVNCGQDRDPSLYQRVQPHLDWINARIGAQQR